MRATPVILLAVCLVGMVSMFALNNQVLLPLVSTDLLGGGAAIYGFLGAASGIGSLISSLSMAFGQRPTIRLLLVGARRAGPVDGAAGPVDLAAGVAADHGPGGLGTDRDGRDDQHRHPAHGPRRAARPGDERLHHDLRGRARPSARSSRGRRGESAGGGAGRWCWPGRGHARCAVVAALVRRATAVAGVCRCWTTPSAWSPAGSGPSSR